MRSVKTGTNIFRGGVAVMVLCMATALAGAKTGTKTAAHASITIPKRGVSGALHPGYRPGARAGVGRGYTRTGRPTGSRPAVNRAPRYVPPGGRVKPLANGGRVVVDKRGRMRSIRANGMTIHRGFRGGRTIETERNGRRLVSLGRHRGYMERPYFRTRDGRLYFQRTYVRNGVVYTRAYRRFAYRGIYYERYAPVYYYHPVFYQWAYNPWPAPVYYNWAWTGAPWYAYYGPYFAPYPDYPAASLWLTDYLIAEDLTLAYQEHADASASGTQTQDDATGAGSTAAQLSPQVKQAIADEVKRQLAAEQQSASASPDQSSASDESVPPALDPSERVFIVSSNLDVSAGNQECSLTPGDVILRLTETPDANQDVNATVQASKMTDCPAGSLVAVSVQDLEEMHNSLQAQIDAGLKTLATNQGKAGLPAAPDTGTSVGEVLAPPADTGVAGSLQAQEQEADQTERQVQQQTLAQKNP
jgi:hypothetical protein